MPFNPAHAQSPPVETTDRPWLLESEFDANPNLHATDGQTVILHLEPAASRGQGTVGPPEQTPGTFRHNRFRLLVEDQASYRFCIPADEPFLWHLTVSGVSRKGGQPVIQARRGGKCDAVTLDPGPYLVDVSHDVRGVLTGKTAFIRLPDNTRLTGDPLTAGTATLALMTWKGTNGKFVTVPNGAGNLVASATEVDKYTVWKLDGSGTFKLYDGVGGAVQSQADASGTLCPPPLFIGPSRSGPPLSCGSRAIEFYFADASATQFRLIGQNTAYSEDGLYGYDSGFKLDGSNQVVSEEAASNTGIPWTVGYRGFTCTSNSCAASQLQLQTGEVALFTAENYQGTAFVFAADVPDFSIYSGAAALGLGIADDQAMSVRVGPDTLALLYSGTNSGGSTIGTTGDIPSLTGLAVGPKQLSSLEIAVPRSYIVDSNGCAYCNLTGVDLSGLDLSDADFSGANLTGANLTDTTLFSARLDGAKLTMATISGADFVDASLRCTNLSDSDLTSARFAVANDAIAAVSDENLAAVVSVDPETGGRAILTGAGTGAGEVLGAPKGLAATAEGLLLVDQNRLLKVLDGERTLISSADRGSGPGFLAAAGVAVSGDGSIFVTDVLRQAIFAVDPDTGDRTVVSSSRVGSGPGFVSPFALTISEQGVIYVADGEAVRVFAVDPATGNRSVVSDVNNGNGPALAAPGGIVLDGDGSLLVVDWGLAAVLRIDPGTGDRSLVSGGGTGAGPAFSGPTAIAVKPDGSFLVVDTALPGLFEIAADSGDRIILSDAVTGGGPDFSVPVDITLTSAAALSSRIATDFSCRLNLARSTVDIDTIPAELWRYLDLTGATIYGAQGAQLSSATTPLDLSGAILNAVNLAGSVLDSANLGCATGSAGPVCTSLQSTNLAQASLKAAKLTSAQLQGASLSDANLDGANLSNAKLLGLPGGSPATLSGAFLRGANLSRADLSGVIADNVNFYSFSGATANAADAVMTGAKFNNAYLAGADFSSATLQSTEWTQAVLVGANFTAADLSKNETAGEVTDFSNAYLQGAAFANASVTDANFYGSYWDLSSTPTTLNIQLLRGNLNFTGYWKDPSVAECVQASYPNTNNPSSSTPATDSSNTCPNGGLGDSVTGCNGFWNDAPIPIGEATPPGAVNPAYPGSSCTSADRCWLMVSSLCAPH